MAIDDVVHLLRVHARSKRRRADDIAEHDGELATFAFVLDARQRRAMRCGSCPEQRLPMAEQDPQVPKVGGRTSASLSSSAERVRQWLRLAEAVKSVANMLPDYPMRHPRLHSKSDDIVDRSAILASMVCPEGPAKEWHVVG
jgi:hypothetical protein